MKTKILTIFTAALLLGSSPLFFSCEQKAAAPTPDGQTPSERPQPKPDQDNPMGMSEELQQQLEEIYANVSLEPQTVTDVHQLALLTSVSASRDGLGPITVTPALLNGEEITLVTLGGTQFVEGQATTLEESQLASFGKANDYLYALTARFSDGTIPAGKPVLLTGISLGGMIAQQILSVDEVLASHQFKAIVTFGSPITLPLDRKGVKIVRFTDANDKVPQMGELPLNSGLVQVEGLSRDEVKAEVAALNESERVVRKSQYSGMIDTHAMSYISEPCWDDVDFLGDPAKTNVLELTAPMAFYPAPKKAK